LRLTPDKFHGDWNYSIAPTSTSTPRNKPRALRAKL
jgi:hypothetical protein